MKAIFETMVAILLVAILATPGISSELMPGEVRPISPGQAYAAPCAQLPFGTTDPEAEFQPQIAVHPDSPERLAVVWTQGLFLSAMVGLSDDGGETWHQVHVPISRCSGGEGGFAGDPWIVWGPDGTLYIAALTGAQVGGDAPSKVVVTRSEDGGHSWSAPVVVEDDGRFNDREAMAVDPSDADRLYLAWTKKIADGTEGLRQPSYSIALADSRDGGRTWRVPRIIHHAPPGWWPSGISVIVLRDETILVAFEQLDRAGGTGNAHELVLRSTDHGATWTLATVSATSAAWPRDPDTRTDVICNAAREVITGNPATEVIGNAAPSLAIDRDGAVVLAWQDIDRADGGDPWPDTARILVSRSNDGGVTWGPATVVRSGEGQAWGPTIAAGPKGELVLTWYDTRADDAGDEVWTGEVWSAHAHDDSPDHWTETRVAGPFDLLTGLRTGPCGPITLGNYFGLAPITGGFGAVFSLPGSDDAEARQHVVFAELTAPGLGHNH